MSSPKGTIHHPPLRVALIQTLYQTTGTGEGIPNFRHPYTPYIDWKRIAMKLVTVLVEFFAG